MTMNPDQFQLGGDIFSQALGGPALPFQLPGFLNTEPPESAVAAEVAQSAAGPPGSFGDRFRKIFDPERMQRFGRDQVIKALMSPEAAGQRPPGAGATQTIPRAPVGPAQLPQTDFSTIFRKPPDRLPPGPNYLKGQF